LEAQLRVKLFDRTGRRPILTEAGRALIADARKLALDLDAMSSRARGLAQGLEPELPLVVDVMFPLDRLVAALGAFGHAFPSVPPRLYVEALGAVPKLVLDGICTLGIAGSMPYVPDGLAREALAPVELVPVASPTHPLAGQPMPVPPQAMREHLQLVLTDRSDLTEGRDYAVLGVRTWRLADLGAKHAMLLAGLGWGNMPRHMVAEDLAAGRLVLIWPAEWASGAQLLPMQVIYRADAALGPATRWFVKHLKGLCGQTAPAGASGEVQD
jgi:DNA-binding transcriptional LysR family regulator